MSHSTEPAMSAALEADAAKLVSMGQDPGPQVSCDLCGWPMPIPTICRESGEILGLLVCTACVEDQLEALVQ